MPARDRGALARVLLTGHDRRRSKRRAGNVNPVGVRTGFGWEPPRTAVGNRCATEVLDVFKSLDQCPGQAMKTQVGLCETYSDCAEGTEVSICMVSAPHTGIYANPGMDMDTEAWEFSRRFYVH